MDINLMNSKIQRVPFPFVSSSEILKLEKSETRKKSKPKKLWIETEIQDSSFESE